MIAYDAKDKREIQALGSSLTPYAIDHFPLFTTPTNQDPDSPLYTYNFLGGERRLIQKPVELCSALVNSVVPFADENRASALPGKLLRSSQCAV